MCSGRTKQELMGEQSVGNLFETFSVVFASPMTETERASRCTIVAKEHLTRWLIGKATTIQTTDIALVYFG